MNALSLNSVVSENEKKITITINVNIPNSITFTINKEDHTIGNMIKSQLLKDPNVIFAGYKNPHPLENKIIIIIQTISDYTPIDAINNAFSNLISELSIIENKFKESIKKMKS